MISTTREASLGRALLLGIWTVSDEMLTTAVEAGLGGSIGRSRAVSSGMVESTTVIALHSSAVGSSASSGGSSIRVLAALGRDVASLAAGVACLSIAVALDGGTVGSGAIDTLGGWVGAVAGDVTGSLAGVACQDLSR